MLCVHAPEAPEAPAGSPAMNAEAYGCRRGLGMAQPEKEARILLLNKLPPALA